MPAVYFQVRWPDGAVEHCYSPSTVIRDYLASGEYSLNDFVARCQKALDEASERVHARFGFYCSSAQDQQQHIVNSAQRFAEFPAARVIVEGLEDAS